MKQKVILNIEMKGCGRLLCPACKLKRLTIAQTQKECIEYFLNFIDDCETIICNSDKLEELEESLALIKKEFEL